MATRKYDKSKVMKRAWYIYRHSFMSFAEALREAWKRIKEEVEAEEKAAARRGEFSKKNTVYNNRLNRTYYGCKFGRDDWKRDYQNDVRAAVKRAVDMNRLYR